MRQPARSLVFIHSSIHLLISSAQVFTKLLPWARLRILETRDTSSKRKRKTRSLSAFDDGGRQWQERSKQVNKKQTIIANNDSFSHAGHCSRRLTYPTPSEIGTIIISIGKETGAQRGYVTCPRSPVREVKEQEPRPWQWGSSHCVHRCLSHIRRRVEGRDRLIRSPHILDN